MKSSSSAFWAGVISLVVMIAMAAAIRPSGSEPVSVAEYSVAFKPAAPLLYERRTVDARWIGHDFGPAYRVSSPTAFLLSAQTVDDAGDHTQEAGDAAPAARSKGEIEPGLAAKIERGRELLFAARIDEAIEVAAELIDAAPEDSIGYRIRVDAAFCDLVWGDFDRAAADCTAVLRIDGPDAAVLCSRGHAYWLVGDNESARRDFEEALLVKPGYAKALNNLGFLAKENGDFREAMDYFSRAIESNSEYSFAYANRGHLHYLEGRLEAALADQNEALRLAPRRLFQTYVDRGDTHAALEEWQAAIFDYGNAIQLDYYSSAYGGVFEKRGKAYEMTGALERAAVDFARAKEFE